MTGFRYRIAYPIENDQLTTAQVTRQAVLSFADDATDRGVHITGDPTVRIDGDRVICEADAQPIVGRRVAAADRYALRIEELAKAGLNDRQIAEQLGDVGAKTVFNVRQAHGIPSPDPRGGGARPRIGTEAA